MSDINGRMRRLRAQLAPYAPKMVLTYSDGTERRVGPLEAFDEIVGGKGVVGIRGIAEPVPPGFDDLLEHELLQQENRRVEG